MRFALEDECIWVLVEEFPPKVVEGAYHTVAVVTLNDEALKIDWSLDQFEGPPPAESLHFFL